MSFVYDRTIHQTIFKIIAILALKFDHLPDVRILDESQPQRPGG